MVSSIVPEDLGPRLSQAARLMNEADRRVELREASDASLDTGHADEDHAHVGAVENGAHLLETVHLQPVGLIDDDEGGRVATSIWPCLMILGSLKVDGIRCRSITGRTLWSHEDLAPPCLVAKPERFEHSLGFPLDWPHSNASQLSRALPRSKATLEGVLITSAVYKTVSNGMEGVVPSIIASQRARTTVTSSRERLAYTRWPVHRPMYRYALQASLNSTNMRWF